MKQNKLNKLSMINTCISGVKSGVHKINFWKEMRTFIQKGCMKLINSDSKDIHNVTQDLYFK